MIFFNKKHKKSIQQIHSTIHHSFQNVQRDTAYILKWLSYFYHKSQQQSNMIHHLQHQIDLTPKTQDVKKIIDDYYSLEPITQKVREIDERLTALQGERPTVSHSVAPPSEEIARLNSRLEKLEQKKANIKEKIIKRITKNSKDYIKSVLLSYIQKYETIPALQLKEMVVEEQGLCSKSSFYRLLEEIEEQGNVAVVKKGKEKHYVAQLSQKNE